MKTIFKLTTLISVAIIFFSIACNPGRQNEKAMDGKLQGKITISGAFALYPMAVKWAEEFQKIHPQVKVNISAGGAGKGMADALSGMVDLGMFSKEVSPEEQAKGAWWIAVAKDAVLPTISSENPVLKELKSRGLKRQDFYEIFIEGKVRTWGEIAGTSNSEEIQTFTRSDACGAADEWAKYLNNKRQEDLLGIGVNGDPGLADALRRNPEAIGYNNLNFVYDINTNRKYDGLEVIPIDLNDNGFIDPEEDFYDSLQGVMTAIRERIYPSPPARDLYFVSKGKPVNLLAVEFLKWIITDGQQFLTQAGYVAVDADKLKASLDELSR